MDKSEIMARFGINVEERDITPTGNGHINDTFKVTARPASPFDYILQRINHHIFTDVDALQSNIENVTAHIRRKLEKKGEHDIDRKVIKVVKEKSTGKSYFFDGESYWRVMVFIDDALTRESITPENARHAGVAFGQFQMMLSDIPDKIDESIPDFHNMELRLRQFSDAIDADKAGRRKEVAALIDQLIERSEHACLAEKLFREDRLPKRICHCDTKINNMLFDRNGEVLCVIDLDTVMPSFIFSDYGDFLRTAANKGDEDDRNLDRVEFDMEIFKAFTEGYLKVASDFLTDVEIENLPYAAERFAYMQAVRFLTDYLNGDTYYKTAYPEHNLVRTKAQFKLLQSIESHKPEMKEFINSIKR